MSVYVRMCGYCIWKCLQACEIFTRFVAISVTANSNSNINKSVAHQNKKLKYENEELIFENAETKNFSLFVVVFMFLVLSTPTKGYIVS